MNKILIVGSWHSKLHEEPLSLAFNDLGYQSLKFSWCNYFVSNNRLVNLYYKFQNKYMIGDRINKLNTDLVKFVIENKPSIIFLYRATHIKRETLEAIKNINKDIYIISYNNDNPFQSNYKKLYWRLFFSNIALVDKLYVYRSSNIYDFLSLGYSNVSILRSWYIPSENYIYCVSDKYKSDVIFVGHFEDDFRFDYVKSLASFSNINFKLFGSGWNRVIKNDPVLKKFFPVSSDTFGVDYAKYLSGSKIALCFFSKLNRDTYTRRCFEIPASGSLLFSEYSDDLASMFREGIEAVFFRSKDDFINKIHYYLDNNDLRIQIAQQGNNRLLQDGHDVFSRAKQVIEDLPINFQLRRLGQ